VVQRNFARVAGRVGGQSLAQKQGGVMRLLIYPTYPHHFAGRAQGGHVLHARVAVLLGHYGQPGWVGAPELGSQLAKRQHNGLARFLLRYAGHQHRGLDQQHFLFLDVEPGRRRLIFRVA
jgi:hypothetical protein